MNCVCVAVISIRYKRINTLLWCRYLSCLFLQAISVVIVSLNTLALVIGQKDLPVGSPVSNSRNVN